MLNQDLLHHLLFSSCSAFNQKTIIESTAVNNDKMGTCLGVKISRYTSTALIYRNNSITSINAYGYMLQAVGEKPGFKNNKLANESIIGNQFTWEGYKLHKFDVVDPRVVVVIKGMNDVNVIINKSINWDLFCIFGYAKKRR